MTSTHHILIATTIFGICLAPLGAQASRTDEIPGRAMLSVEDIGLFEPLLTTYLDAAPGVAEKKAQEEFLSAMSDFSMRNGHSSPVADCKAWLDMFDRHKAAGFIKEEDCQANSVYSK